MEGYIKGQYRKSIFTSDNGYIIGIFKVGETNIDNLSNYVGRTITFTGYFHELNEIDNYIFYGDLITHPKYGDQFQVNRYEITKPVEKDAIVEFLASGLFKGIGDKKASKIMLYFKTKENLCNADVQELARAGGISIETAQELYKMLH